MVQRYARAACNECHLRLPKPHLHRVTKKEQTGSTGWGFSLGASVYGKKKNKSRSQRYYSPRKRYSLKTRWYCTECFVAKHPWEARSRGVKSKKQIEQEALKREREKEQKAVKREEDKNKAVLKLMAAIKKLGGDPISIDDAKFKEQKIYFEHIKVEIRTRFRNDNIYSEHIKALQKQLTDLEAKEKRKGSFKKSKNVAAKLIFRIQEQIKKNKQKFSKSNIKNINLGIQKLNNAIKNAAPYTGENEQRFNRLNNNLATETKSLKSTFYSNCSFGVKLSFKLFNWYL